MENMTNPEERFSPMIRAYLMMMVTGRTSVNFLNAKRLKREMTEYVTAFGIEENGAVKDDDAQRELSAFAEYFIDSCLHSSAFRTTLFGTIPMSDDGAATRLAEDIHEVTGTIATRFGIAELVRPLRTALFEAYKSQVKNSFLILEELHIEP